MSYGKDILYHYTSILGLYGIIGSKGLRFGEFGKANDPRETCGICEFRYISFTVDGAVEGWANPLMWYMYGHKYGGVCIGFDKSKLLRLNRDLDLDSFPITYRDGDMPHVLQFGIEPVKYKLSVWSGENEFRIINKGNEELLKINIDCIERIYFMNPTPKRFTLPFREIHTIGLNYKLTNIAFCNRDIVTINSDRCNGEGGFVVAPSGKIAVAVLGDDLLTEQEIYQRSKDLYDEYSNEDNNQCSICMETHRKCKSNKRELQSTNSSND